MMQALSLAEGRALLKKPHKYRAKACEVDGIKFPSQHEAREWCKLTLQEKAGEISNLRRQVRYALHDITGRIVGHLVMDFVYQDPQTGHFCCLDAKGFRTPLYKWKKRHFESEYQTPIIEV